MAYAAGRFAESCLRGLAGDAAVECAYVDSDVVPGCDFFATKIEIGPEGVMKIYPVGDITPYERTSWTRPSLTSRPTSRRASNSPTRRERGGGGGGRRREGGSESEGEREKEAARARRRGRPPFQGRQRRRSGSRLVGKKYETSFRPPVQTFIFLKS